MRKSLFSPAKNQDNVNRFLSPRKKKKNGKKKFIRILVPLCDRDTAINK